MIPNAVVEKYSVYKNITLEGSSNLYRRLESYFDLAVIDRKIQPDLDVDDAWHYFLLYTLQYSEYCLDRYGHYLHHEIFEDDQIDPSKAKCRIYILN